MAKTPAKNALLCLDNLFRAVGDLLADALIVAHDGGQDATEAEIKALVENLNGIRAGVRARIISTTAGAHQ